ncbi:MAG: GGDEF domain-containing protein [Ilumatobacteraceae bacterium]|nr:GGDEF domain-containing protein [Ilumatobacteraceae bacterium]
MGSGEEQLVEAVKELRHGRTELLDSLLALHARTATGDGALLSSPRSSGPHGAAGDSAEAWADRTIRCIFDMVGAGRGVEAHMVATAAVTAFCELDDDDQQSRILAAAAVTGLGVGELNHAFDLAVRSMVLLWGGLLSPDAAASTANSLGTFFDRLGAWDLAIDQFETALSTLDPTTHTGALRAELTIVNLVMCLHEVISDGRALPEADRVAHVDRLHQLATQLRGHGPSSTVWYGSLLADASLALVEERFTDAALAAELLGAVRDSMVVREELAWRLAGAAAMLGAQRLSDADHWATAALRLAELGDEFRVPDVLRRRAAIRWALGDQSAAFSDSMAAVEAMAATRSDRIIGLAAGLAHRARLELVRRELSDVSASLAITAARDPLTGLANRRGLDEVISLLAQSQQRASMLVVDIDHFKLVNDTCGHDAGDEVIKACAELLRQAIGPAGLIVRLGGDEFVVVLPDGKAQPHRIGETVCEGVRGYGWHTIAEGLRVTVSVGAAVGAARDLRELMARADGALYDAKRAGRNAVVSVDRRQEPRGDDVYEHLAITRLDR